jgi:hypothetical protein
MVLGGCSLFSKEESKTTTTTTSTTEATSTSSTTQPPGDAGVEALKPVLDALVKEEARLIDAMLFNNGAAFKDPNSPERAAYFDLFTGREWPDALLESIGEPMTRGRYLAPVPGETQANFGWVLDVHPVATSDFPQGAPNEVEFTQCALGRGIIVDEAGHQVDDTNSVGAGRTLARRQDGVWKIDAAVEDLDPALCAGGPPA